MITIKNILFLILIAFTTTVWGKSKDFERYIEKYQYLAISEMERTGIPASIKLAQALLESNAGRSVLARKAKNHFGIKCGSKWRGKKHYRKDDDYRRGKLVKSCFRSYKKVENSFIAHSEFLLANKRYRFLFKISPTNYKKWAKGLKKAGYATSSTYDKKLIRLIERYDLHRYDSAQPSIPIANNKTKTKKVREVFSINDAKLVHAKIGDTPSSIAKRTKTSIKRILAYNEALQSSNQPLNMDEKVYLQKKRKNYRGKQKVHQVAASETMYDIAQLYGLRLDKLYKKNKMSPGTQPAVGALIRIRGKAKRRPKLKLSETPPPPVLIEDKVEKPSKTDSNIIDLEEADKTDLEPTTTADKKETAQESVEEKPIEKINTKPDHVEQPPVIKKEEVEKKSTYHVVAKGDTLWNISQRYGLTVANIMKMNRLDSKIIRVGMKLRVK
jgi:LysM repeat protein